MTGPDRRDALIVAVLALVVSASSLGNRFAFDDGPIIVNNARVHTLLPPWRYFQQTYWPPEIMPSLYRPVTVLGFAVEWWVGDGSPLVFHVVSVVLYAAACAAAFRLARSVLQPGPALLVGLLFAAHPVHVEAVANAVGQPEILVALLEFGLVAWYVTVRSRRIPTPQETLCVAAIYGVACFTKEHAIMVPALLFAAETTLVRSDASRAGRTRSLFPFYRALFLAAVGFLVVRTTVLGGLVGDIPNTAIRGAGFVDRCLTMLGVVPVGVRLLLVPSHLQADYMPRELVLATRFGAPQLAGALLLLAIGALAWWARRRQPVATFGVLWLAITLLPVSNLLVPSGILLAERTLFTPSLGAMLAVGALGQGAAARWSDAGTATRLATMAFVAVVLIAGSWRSASRGLVWRNDETLLPQTVLDAPLSFNAHKLYAALLAKQGRSEASEREYHIAMELNPNDPGLIAALADRRRLVGDCPEAMRLYREVLRIAPESWVSRTKLILCLARLGDSASAKQELDELKRRGEGDPARVEATIAAMATTQPVDSQ